MTNELLFPVSTATPLRLILPPTPSEPTQTQLVLYSPPKKKKRTKLVRVDNNSPTKKTGTTRSKKPDPSAPKITRPCTECGKKFWSWKALFGHMRCHPERQWRGINPPANFRRVSGETVSGVTEEDREVATCLLLLANGPSKENYIEYNVKANISVTDHNIGSSNPNISSTKVGTEKDGSLWIVGANSNICGANTEKYGSASFYSGNAGYYEFKDNVGFECSSCKKVFGSHQALGGHRASHKNVKGCFAINNKGGDVAEEEMAVMELGHKRGICERVFSSGQALKGHKRCRFEKGGLNCLDLNLPAPVEDYNEFIDPFACFSSGLALDLRLGI